MREGQLLDDALSDLGSADAPPCTGSQVTSGGLRGLAATAVVEAAIEAELSTGEELIRVLWEAGMAYIRVLGAAGYENEGRRKEAYEAYMAAVDGKVSANGWTYVGTSCGQQASVDYTNRDCRT